MQDQELGYEYDGFGWQPGSGVAESLDAAGVDGHVGACPGAADDWPAERFHG